MPDGPPRARRVPCEVSASVYIGILLTQALPGANKLQVTLDEQTRQKLAQLQDLLAHRIPNGDPARILELAFDALLAQVHKRKTGVTDKPRARKPAPATKPRTREIAAAVRREVWTRDQGRCGFIGEDGHRCNETRRVEFAHLEPWGKGGADTPRNLALRCQAHNALEADRDYGTSFMASKRKRAPGREQGTQRQVSTKPLRVRELVAPYRAYRRTKQNGWTSPPTVIWVALPASEPPGAP